MQVAALSCSSSSATRTAASSSSVTRNHHQARQPGFLGRSVLSFFFFARIDDVDRSRERERDFCFFVSFPRLSPSLSVSETGEINNETHLTSLQQKQNQNNEKGSLHADASVGVDDVASFVDVDLCLAHRRRRRSRDAHPRHAHAHGRGAGSAAAALPGPPDPDLAADGLAGHRPGEKER